MPEMFMAVRSRQILEKNHHGNGRFSISTAMNIFATRT
jgi:hypothetical protein